jgi:predicted amino acid-binding ACT domain protein
MPYVFTEHGAIMAANVLNSNQAVRMSVFVVRAFVKLRETALQYKELAAKLTELERKVGIHDHAIASTIASIRQLMSSPARERKPIGFRAKPAKK